LLKLDRICVVDSKRRFYFMNEKKMVKNMFFGK